MDVAKEAGVTVQEWNDETREWEIIAGDGPGWVAPEGAEHGKGSP